MSETIIIIGGGIAGLAAGCYGQMNGYRTQIFELHELPGGLCTAWERRGYTFDGCIHYLLGSGEGQPFNQVWQELGALVDRPVIDHTEFMRVVDTGGRTLTLYSDPDRLESHMQALSPEDADLIADFADGVRDFLEFDLSLLQQKPKGLMGGQDWRVVGVKMLPFVRPLAQWGLLSAEDFAERFKDPFLRRAMAHIFGWPEIPMMAGLSLIAAMQKRNAGFPAGASLAFAQAIERRYVELGGQIHYNAQVEKILVEGDRAVGVRLYDDSIHYADVVISAADGRGTIYDLLGGRYLDRKIRRTYDGHLPLHTQMQISFGIDRDLTDEPHWVTYLLDEPVLIAGEERHELGVKHYCFDPSLAPEGKSSVIVMLRSNYAYWQRIYGRRLYDDEQRQVSGQVVDFLEGLYPGIRSQIEVVDEATPVSYERYTGNWMGATTGWLLTNETMSLLIQGLPKTLPGLENFYMAGQWVEPGGMVPVVAMSGRNAIQLICEADRRPFKTTTV